MHLHLAAASCKSLYAKEPLVIGLFCGMLVALLRSMTYKDKASNESWPPYCKLAFENVYLGKVMAHKELGKLIRQVGLDTVVALPPARCFVLDSCQHVPHLCVLRCVAVCCGVLRCVGATGWIRLEACALPSVLQCVEVCCSVLQCVAVCGDGHLSGCTTQRHVRLDCMSMCVAAWCSVVQRVAMCCSVLQRGAVCCNVLQRVAAICCIGLEATPSICMDVYMHKYNIYIYVYIYICVCVYIYVCIF